MRGNPSAVALAKEEANGEILPNQKKGASNEAPSLLIKFGMKNFPKSPTETCCYAHSPNRILPAPR